MKQPRPPDELVDALQDRIHPASGRLIAASPVMAPARARPDALRDMLGDLADEAPILLPDDVPELTDPAERCWWIAMRLAEGTWRTRDLATIAQRWGVTERYARNYASTAGMFLRLQTNDVDKLAKAAHLRIERRARVSDDERVQQRADEIILTLTGHLKGGAEQASMTTAEREAAIIDSIANPDDDMERLLREAFSRGSDRLRGLIAEFGGVVTEGEAK